MAIAIRRGLRLSDLALEYEAQESGRPTAEITADMNLRLAVMQASIEQGCQPGLYSRSGLTGPVGHLLAERERQHQRPTLAGRSVFLAARRAIAIVSVNAAMGRVVATPTAGSSGIVPAVLLTAAETLGLPSEAVVQALFTAGLIGLVIGNRATLSGAAGGCQAEVGSAAAMAAGAAAEMGGGSPEAVASAVGLVLQNSLGLICDPVAGLVEIPCIYRNAGFAAVALVMADLALAGVRLPLPADEVIDAMGQVGRLLPVEWRETAQGGLAATPTACRLARQLCGHTSCPRATR
ncbi:MAG: L-serine ammonia-lyase, iron-sulfur-dependent, subunit alpha [Limnochordaceae bacterium]|nr:L-serine ammonia-lyase, iron-sulfur-dependent, subunit alpha [Limnochordaceae bacterium]